MNTENNYQATDLGNISPNPRGDYDASASYEYLDLVNMNGGSYICLAELGTTVTGVSPEPGKTTETWQCIALPGDLTPEYIAMHDDVVNKAESVAEDTKNVTEMHENVTGMESNVQELQKQAAQSAEEAEASKDAAAGYARAADASRQAAEEAEANVNAQVTGFDSHVAEKTAEAEGAIVKARQAAVEVVSEATNTATNAAERAGSAASRAEEAKTAAAGSETNAADSASAAKTSETNAKASEEAAKAAMQAAQDAAAGVVADREQITALKKNRSSAIVQTASGTAIVVQDSSDDPVRGLRVFGRTTQDGTPTLDAPVPLVSAGDAGSVEVSITDGTEDNVQSLTLQTPNGLPGVPVSKDGNYTDSDGQQWVCDEIDLKKEKYVQRIKKVVINSDTDIQAFLGDYGAPQKNTILGRNTDKSVKKTGAILCKELRTFENWRKDEESVYTNEQSIDFRLSRERLGLGIESTNEQNRASILKFLETTQLHFIVQLATPIERDLTQEELAAYEAFHTNYPTTVITNDAGAHMEFSYNADPKNYIAAEHAKMEAAFDAKLAEIIALLPAETQAAMIENETTNLLNESEE